MQTEKLEVLEVTTQFGTSDGRIHRPQEIKPFPDGVARTIVAKGFGRPVEIDSPEGAEAEAQPVALEDESPPEAPEDSPASSLAPWVCHDCDGRAFANAGAFATHRNRKHGGLPPQESTP